MLPHHTPFQSQTRIVTKKTIHKSHDCTLSPPTWHAASFVSGVIKRVFQRSRSIHVNSSLLPPSTDRPSVKESHNWSSVILSLFAPELKLIWMFGCENVVLTPVYQKDTFSNLEEPRLSGNMYQIVSHHHQKLIRGALDVSLWLWLLVVSQLFSWILKWIFQTNYHLPCLLLIVYWLLHESWLKTIMQQ